VQVVECDDKSDGIAVNLFPSLYSSLSMRTSSQRTPVAILRKLIGQRAPEFAKMVGLSLSAVEKLESGRLKISEAVAQKISFETGVDARWLLEGDPQMRPFPDVIAQEYLSARPDEDYSKEVFDRVRAARQAKQSPIPEGEHTREEQIICLLFRLAFIYSSARANGEEAMALYRFHNFEEDIAEEFGLSLDGSAFELALTAGRSFQRLANRLKREQKDLSALAFAPGKVDPVNDKRPVKFLQFRHRTAKAMRAINQPREE
jgi:transcriptional regulator with XRE-family HTH domain